MKKIISLALVLVMIISAVACFASCGKDNNNTKDFVVVTNCPFEPFEYVGEDGKAYGVDIEIAAAFCQAKGYNLVIKNIAFDSIFTEVDQGNADIGMAGITVSADRAELYDFSDKYYNASQKIIVKVSNTKFDACTTASEVEAILGAETNATKYGYQNGTTGGMYINGDADWGYDGFANLSGTGYATALDAVNDMVLNGTVEGVVVDEAPANAIVEALNKQGAVVKLVNVPLTEEEYAFVIKKGNTTLVNDFNAFLASSKQDGSFQAILDKYFNGTGTKVGYALAQ